MAINHAILQFFKLFTQYNKPFSRQQQLITITILQFNKCIIIVKARDESRYLKVVEKATTPPPLDGQQT